MRLGSYFEKMNVCYWGIQVKNSSSLLGATIVTLVVVKMWINSLKEYGIVSRRLESLIIWNMVIKGGQERFFVIKVLSVKKKLFK